MVRQVNYKLRHLDLETDTVHDSDSIPCTNMGVCNMYVACARKKSGCGATVPTFFFNLNNFFINFEVNSLSRATCQLGAGLAKMHNLGIKYLSWCRHFIHDPSPI